MLQTFTAADLKTVAREIFLVYVQTDVGRRIPAKLEDLSTALDPAAFDSEVGHLTKHSSLFISENSVQPEAL